MSIYEFDQELHDKTIRRESWEDGLEEGQQKLLFTQICKKLRKGKSIEQIAEDLEDDVAKIRNICEAAEAFAPEYDEEQVFNKVIENSMCK